MCQVTELLEQTLIHTLTYLSFNSISNLLQIGFIKCIKSYPSCLQGEYFSLRECTIIPVRNIYHDKKSPELLLKIWSSNRFFYNERADTRHQKLTDKPS